MPPEPLAWSHETAVFPLPELCPGPRLAVQEAGASRLTVPSEAGGGKKRGPATTACCMWDLWSANSPGPTGPRECVYAQREAGPWLCPQKRIPGR